MNKKKLLVLLTSLTLVAVVGIGATLAYFTDSDAATNVITMGHVDVDLEEPNFDPDDDDDTIEDVTPGQEIVKDPTIKVVEGSEDAYIRAKIELSSNLNAEQAKELMNGIKIKDGWYLSADGYYYYNEVVTSETKTERKYPTEDGYATEEVDGVVLFDIVSIPETWGNEVADMTFKIIVSAEAIQADNFEPTVENGMITAWTYSDGTAIKAETYGVEGEITPAEDAE